MNALKTRQQHIVQMLVHTGQHYDAPREGCPRNAPRRPCQCAEVCILSKSYSSRPASPETVIPTNPFAHLRFSRVLSRGGGFNMDTDVSAEWQGACI